MRHHGPHHLHLLLDVQAIRRGTAAAGAGGLARSGHLVRDQRVFVRMGPVDETDVSAFSVVFVLEMCRGSKVASPTQLVGIAASLRATRPTLHRRKRRKRLETVVNYCLHPVACPSASFLTRLPLQDAVSPLTRRESALTERPGGDAEQGLGNDTWSMNVNIRRIACMM